jgi:phage shock protein A
MCSTEVALGAVSWEVAAAVELRRAAVLALARQQELRERLARLHAEARFVEERAERALRRGEEILARQILARGLCALEARDALERELAEARREVLALAASLARPRRAGGGAQARARAAAR